MLQQLAARKQIQDTADTLVMSRILLLAMVSAAILWAQSGLQLVDHDAAAPVRPGETVTIAAPTSTPYQQVFLFGQDPLQMIQALSVPPYHFAVAIPANIAAGRYRFWAKGCKGPGDCDDLGEVTIDVEPLWPASADASHAVKDAPGVTIDMCGNPVMHRSAIAYPKDALAAGVGGTVIVEITPDWEGRAEGVQILDGPDELRKDVIKQVLLWHFPREAGQKPRRVKITFDPYVANRLAPLEPAAKPVRLGERGFTPYISNLLRQQPAHTAMPATPVLPIGLSEDARTALLNRIPIQPNQPLDFETIARLSNLVHNFDNDLTLWFMPLGEKIAIVVTTPGLWLPEVDPTVEHEKPTAAPSPKFTPQRIRVAAATQAAKLVSKVDPEYPTIAKANHIQGVVHVWVLIGNDGGIQRTMVTSGHALLSRAAEEAVSKWTYSPTLVNGTPVEVTTEVEVEFFLPN